MAWHCFEYNWAKSASIGKLLVSFICQFTDTMENLKFLVEKCQLCKSNMAISNYILSAKPESFVGSNSPKVLIIGHSPTVRTTQPATVVLKLNKNTQPLYQYITSRILNPLNIDLSEVYATNLIKCQTLTLPEKIKKDVDFFNLSFANCRLLLEEEILKIKPELIISLSETVLKILSKNYIGKELAMQDSFAKMHILTVNGVDYKYIPLVHIPKYKNSVAEKHYFPEQTERLKRIRWRSS